MNTYRFKVTLEIEIDAFDETDAEVALEDAFGMGENLGVRITNCVYKELRARPAKR